PLHADEYLVSIAMITTWSKLDPVGAAETGLGNIRSVPLIIESTMSSNGSPIFFRLWSMLILFLSSLCRFGFPTRSARDSFGVLAENQTLFDERVPRQELVLPEDSQRHL